MPGARALPHLRTEVNREHLRGSLNPEKQPRPWPTRLPPTSSVPAKQEHLPALGGHAGALAARGARQPRSTAHARALSVPATQGMAPLMGPAQGETTKARPLSPPPPATKREVQHLSGQSLCQRPPEGAGQGSAAVPLAKETPTADDRVAQAQQLERGKSKHSGELKA